MDSRSIKGDILFTLRTFSRTPLVTLAAILSLALGIGANTTIFTLVHALFLRPPTVAEPDRLVAVYFEEEGKDALFSGTMPFSRLNFLDLEERTGDVFEGLVNTVPATVNIYHQGIEPEQRFGLMTSGNYFDVLGVRAAYGRTFLADEGGSPQPVIVLSHRYWQESFGGDPAVVGSTVSLNASAFEVIGIAPEGFNGTLVLGSPSFWVPMSMHDVVLTGTMRRWFDLRRAGLTSTLGRLRPGVGLDQAQAAVEIVGQSLQQEYPEDNQNRNFELVPYVEATINPAQRGLFVQAGWVMMGAVGLVLLIACGNVASLLLGRAVARRREIAIRLSLGASRGRLVRQLLTESLLLALVAGGGGLLLAFWMRAGLWAQRPPFLQQVPLDLSFDLPILLFCIGLSAFTGLLFGLVPALQATRPELVSHLKDLATGRGRRSFNLREALVALQVALSFIALFASGLFLRSLSQATAIDLGFRPEGLVTLAFDPGSNGYDRPQGEAFYDRLLERSRAVPGVRSAALATLIPLTRPDLLQTVLIEGRPREAENNAELLPTASVSEGYFRTLGLDLVAGRTFEAFDRQEVRPVAVVNQAMASRFWPGESAVGKRFRFISEEDLLEVVGVVGDSKIFTVGEDPQPVVFLPHRQAYRGSMALLARVEGDSEALLGTLRGELQPLDPTLAITNVQTVESAVGASLWAARMGARLLGALGGVAILLASIGIYGVMAHAVSQRGREIGIRMALGADRRRVVSLVLTRGMLVVGVGVGVGLVAALLLSRTLEALLYDVEPTDLPTFGLTVLVLGSVAVLANLLPASRAASIDPVRALRIER